MQFEPFFFRLAYCGLLGTSLIACRGAGPSVNDGAYVFHDMAKSDADLGTDPKSDMAVPTEDMAAKGDMAKAKSDLSVADLALGDLANPCVEVATWPGVAPAGKYSAANDVTLGWSFDQTQKPNNRLGLQDWHVGGETYPKNYVSMSSDQFWTCEICPFLSVCDANGNCVAKYFAQSGTTNVTKSDKNEAAGTIAATMADVKLLEWDFTNDKAVLGGGCYHIQSATFNYTWNNPVDAGATDLAAAGDMAIAPSTDMAGSCAPKINELQTGGPMWASDEFVELYNPCNSAINLNDWELNYRSAGNNSGGGDTPMYKWITATMIPSGGYLVVSGQKFALPHDAVFSNGGLAAVGGAVALRNAVGAKVDSVSYQTLSGANLFTETAPAPNPPMAQSIARKPNGQDTDDNSADFKVVVTPTPGKAN